MNLENIRWAMRQPGCPVCTLADEHQQRFIRWFLAQYAGSAAMLERLAAGSFCRTHTWVIVRRDKAQQLKGTLKFLVAQEREKISGFLNSGDQQSKRGRLFLWFRRGQAETPEQRWSRYFARQRTCPVCEVWEKKSRKALKILLAALDNHDFRTVYAEGDGLCREHFREAMRIAPPNRRRIVGEIQLAVLERLDRDLYHSIQKERYDVVEKPTESEKQAHYRAGRFLGGNEPK